MAPYTEQEIGEIYSRMQEESILVRTLALDMARSADWAGLLLECKSRVLELVI